MPEMTLRQIIQHDKVNMDNLKQDMVKDTFKFNLVSSKNGVLHFKGGGSGENSRTYEVYFKFPALVGSMDANKIKDILENSPVKVACSGPEFQQKYKKFAKNRGILLNVKSLKGKGNLDKLQLGPAKNLVCRHIYFLAEYLLDNPEKVVEEVIERRKKRIKRAEFKTYSNTITLLRGSKQSLAARTARKMKWINSPEVESFKLGTITFRHKDSLAKQPINKTVIRLPKLRKRKIGENDVKAALKDLPKVFCTCKDFAQEYQKRAITTGTFLHRSAVKNKALVKKWDKLPKTSNDKGVLCRHLYRILNRFNNNPQWLIEKLNTRKKK